MVIYQKPNLPLIIAIAAFLLSFILHGALYGFVVSVFYTALFVWSLLEIFWGINTFRKSLGVIVFLVGIIFLIFGIR